MKTWTKIFGFILLFLATQVVPPNPALAVPTLQLHIDGASYFDEKTFSDPSGSTFSVTESWFSYDNPLTLNVVGAQQPNQVQKITNLKLTLSVQEQFWDDAGKVQVTGGAIDKQISAQEFSRGIPDPFGTGHFPPHGIYPSYYFILDLPDFVFEGSQLVDIYNYNENYSPGTSEPEDFGLIQQYAIEYQDFFHLHFDLTGTAVSKNGRKTWDKFAPFSHDADAPGPAPVPEPGTFVLFGVGMVALGFWRLRKSHT